MHPSIFHDKLGPVEHTLVLIHFGFCEGFITHKVRVIAKEGSWPELHVIGSTML
jgi:hypothetical protein